MNLKNAPTATMGTHSTYAPHSISMTRLNAIDGKTSLLGSKPGTPVSLSPNHSLHAAQRTPTL